MEKSSTRKKVILALAIIIGSALVARMVISVLYFNAFDTYWYRKWAYDLPNGLFSVYSRASQIDLDYPPLYLFCLYLTGLAYRVFGIACSDGMQMFLMKFWPVIFDTLCVFAIYKAARKRGETVALFAAAAWTVNPSAVFNSSFWGQTDGLMALMLIIAFMWAEDRPLLACFMFALAGLTKYQSLFFTPVLLLFIFKRHGIKRLLEGVLAAALTVIAVFLPFMIGAGNPLLFFDVYLGGANTYQYCTFNAYNIYGLLGLNGVYDQTAVWGPITYSHINAALLVLTVAATAFLMLKTKRPNIYVGGLFIMQCIFMLSTRMHERYQMVVLPMALLAFITTRYYDFLWQFIALTAITLINQCVVLFNVNHGTFDGSLVSLMTVVSAINLLCFVHTVYACVKYFLKEEKHDLLETAPAYSSSAEE
ncbi:MAG: glycosyltransferase family 39 protein [Clostridia bacterium]|nr:glycosyltransferase family 39 protein [Clostridia bacterium]